MQRADDGQKAKQLGVRSCAMRPARERDGRWRGCEFAKSCLRVRVWASTSSSVFVCLLEILEQHDELVDLMQPQFQSIRSFLPSFDRVLLLGRDELAGVHFV